MPPNPNTAPKRSAAIEDRANARIDARTDPRTDPSGSVESVELSSTQLQAFKVEPVEHGSLPSTIRRSARLISTKTWLLRSSPYQGRLIALFAEVGDDVQKGQILFTIDSPDLIQAGSTLIWSTPRA